MRPIPTTQQIYEALASDLRSKLGLTEDQLRKVADAVASVESAKIKLLYLYLADVQNNLFPDTADLAANGGQLERIGSIYLNRQPNPATSGLYVASVTGSPGATIRANLTFKSNDDALNPGILFVTDTEKILTGSGDTIDIRALVTGTEGLLEIGNQLTMTEPVSGADQVITITAITEEPRAAESIDDYRQAVLDAIQLEAQGGARTDYRLWASDAQGVRRVYPFVKAGEAGVVQVYVEATAQDSIDGNGTPSAALLQDVLDVIELDPDVTKPIEERGRRPIQAIIETLSIALNPVDVTITGLSEDTQEIRDSIEANIKDYLFDIRPYIAGTDLLRNKNDVLYSARLQGVVSDSLSSSNFYSGFIMDVNGVTVNSFTFTQENIPYLRNLTFN